ncbi:hypothetical protein NC653_027162 [Populus alba x Populus x berolinensis]|uniref:Uncharacterized protein n=1 Tax=Populus alba x Populus x berolinensis TaxID=444605 RepID=A0AAD6M579_9ROSI|nr:hypothetical protein NC653_027162 [Populus alba x Populus x berolinensis]
MGIGNCRIVGALIHIPSCFCSGYDAATETITSSQLIKDPETVSAGNIYVSNCTGLRRWESSLARQLQGNHFMAKFP